MSQESVAVVRRVWDSFMAGGYPGDAFAPDAEWHQADDEPEGGGEPLRGPAAIAAMLADWWENVSDPWVKVDEMIDAGDLVVVVWRGGGVGRASGMAIEIQETHVYEIRDGVVAAVREYRDRSAALAAAGVGESP